MMRRALLAARVAIAGLRRESHGSMAIETAIVAPVLLLMSLGTFEVSRIVAREHELQTGAAEGEAIALAANMGAESDVDTVKDILETSLDLDANQVSVVMKYRCGNDSALLASSSTCNSSQAISTYMVITLTETHSPIWNDFGVGNAMNFSVVRQVQLS